MNPREYTHIIIGAGGHGRVCADVLQCARIRAIAFIDSNPDLGSDVDGVPIIGNDDALLAFNPSSVLLVNGIGGTHNTVARQAVYEKFRLQGFQFDSLRHTSAVKADRAVVAIGTQIMVGAILQPGVRIDENTIVNTGARIDHDTTIGAHCHIAPGVTICGGVVIRDGCHIGTGATIIQGVRIGAGSVIAAGAVVVRDVPAGSKIVGVPGRSVDQINRENRIHRMPNEEKLRPQWPPYFDIRSESAA